MGHHHGIDLLAGDRFVVPALVEFALVDFAGDLLCLHSVAGTGQQEYYGFFQFHLLLNVYGQDFIHRYYIESPVWCKIFVAIDSSTRVEIINIDNRIPERCLA